MSGEIHDPECSACFSARVVRNEAASEGAPLSQSYAADRRDEVERMYDPPPARLAPVAARTGPAAVA